MKLNKYSELASTIINRFDINIENYSCLSTNRAGSLDVKGRGDVFYKGQDQNLVGRVDFGETVNCRVFIGQEVSGEVSVKFTGDNSIVYIGDFCRLNKVQFRSFQSSDLIAVGSYVSFTNNCTLISGNGAGDSNPAILVGDDCMFSNDIVIRSSDGHPIYDLNKGNQINAPNSPVIIEPHCWIGERVLILKALTIGAGSVVSTAAVVTRNCDRASIVAGVPAKAIQAGEMFWSRSETEESKKRAKAFYDAYPK